MAAIARMARSYSSSQLHGVLIARKAGSYSCYLRSCRQSFGTAETISIVGALLKREVDVLELRGDAALFFAGMARSYSSIGTRTAVFRPHGGLLQSFK